MNDTLKRNHPPMEVLHEHGISSNHQENALNSHNHMRQPNCCKASLSFTTLIFKVQHLNMLCEERREAEDSLKKKN
ncbi:hypothetical protein HanPSC8_Chr11g0487051 [Helianthus annuus]|nr:hypothetical protein HanPSC8_Chr11g0487051 [Helianthus annuus]